MKLVDILARELKEWPDRALYAWQDWNLEIRFRHSMENDFFVDRKSCDHVRQKHEGNPTQGVTRSQWQAAVDALKAGEQFWNGEGLPPVGIKVDVLLAGNGSYLPLTPQEWQPMTMKYKSVDFCVFEREDGQEFPMWNPQYSKFRPIRTAEQIAAEERAEAIKEMMTFLGGDGDELINAFGRMYDAGYRKQVQP